MVFMMGVVGGCVGIIEREVLSIFIFKRYSGCFDVNLLRNFV